jgi:hypothetical protein
MTDEVSDVVFNVFIDAPIQTLNTTSLSSSVTYTDIKYNITSFIPHQYKQ